MEKWRVGEGDLPNSGSHVTARLNQPIFSWLHSAFYGAEQITEHGKLSSSSLLRYWAEFKPSTKVLLSLEIESEDSIL